jgi:pyrimidine-nucleoside phosphorylase/thymidine phosphorylase
MIRIKRDGGRHSPDDLEAFLEDYTRDHIPDYQMAAWLMAVYLRGLDRDETLALTRVMLNSGRVLDLASLPGPTVDKHSTGGVGDKISLPLAPIVAACGAYVPMISGRGLGHTGGTLDKLESIPGFTTRLAPERFIEQVTDLGLAFGGQTADLAPADGRLYALRDVTATVECIPLIVSSILSKKFASGTGRVVFDVKTGSGAFMRERERARELAAALLDVTAAMGRSASALITNMDQPLGSAVGNALEVAESIDILKGEGPDDVRELTLTLAGEMLHLAGVAESVKKGEALAAGAVADGTALERFRQVIEKQGGDARVVSDPQRLPRAPQHLEVPAAIDGFICSVNAYAIGDAVVDLGGGRRQKEEDIDPAVGVRIAKRVGDPVRAGEPLAVIHARGSDDGACFQVSRAFEICPERPESAPLVWERLP